MTVPQHRNQKKYRRRKFNPMAGRHIVRLVDKPVEPEEPFSLDDPPPTFEEWLDEIPTFEDWLLADQGERLLADPDDDFGEIYG